MNPDEVMEYTMTASHTKPGISVSRHIRKRHRRHRTAITQVINPWHRDRMSRRHNSKAIDPEAFTSR